MRRTGGMGEGKITYFFNASDLEPEIVEGDVERVIYTGKNLQTIEYHFPPNKTFPAHSHDQHEQMGYLVKGKMGFKVGGVEKILSPGDFYHAPIGVEHNAWTFDEPAVLLDFFAPPREDLMK
jgi:quercetin dioxygenase-like cupin family protein